MIPSSIRGRWRAPIAPLAAGLVLVFCAPASGHERVRLDDELLSILGQQVERTPEGLFRVDVGGKTLVTHGPDRAPAQARRPREGSPFAPGAPERRPACATDYYQHVLVGHLIGEPNRVATVAPAIRSSLARMNHVLNAQAVASGGLTADYKFLCGLGGEIRVDSFESPGESFADVVESARKAGFDSPNVDYTIFFDSDAAARFCGIGSFVDDERLTPANLSNSGGGYAVAYEPCWAGSIPMHENAHNQGAVPYGSPNSTGTGAHCNQAADILCYTPDGGDRNQGPMTRACPSIEFDCNADDYFDAMPEPGEYLATHWNLGSPLNRFVQFGLAPVPSESAADSYLPEECHGRGCATRLRLGIPVGGEIASGNASLYRLALHRPLHELRISVRADVPMSVAIRRDGLPAGRSDLCARRRPGDGGNEICRVRSPGRGRWFIELSALDSGATDFVLVVRPSGRRA